MKMKSAMLALCLAMAASGQPPGPMYVEPVLMSGDAYPPIDGATIDLVGQIVAAGDDRQVLLIATLVGPGINSDNRVVLLRREADGTFSQLLRRGDSIGQPDTVLTSGFLPTMSRSGKTAVVVSYENVLTQDSCAQCEVWDASGIGQAPIVIAAKGQLAPGAAEGATFDSFEQELLINNAGDVVFAARLGGPNSSPNHRGVWFYRPGLGVLPIAIRDQPVSPATPQFHFGSIGSVVMNSSGTVLFEGHMEGGGIRAFENAGLWTFTADRGTELLVQENDPTSGGPAGRFYSEPLFPATNDRGDIAFRASSRYDDDGNSREDATVWKSAHSTGFIPLATSGEQAAGCDLGTDFRGAMTDVLINEQGHVYFHSRVEGPGVDTSNDDGVWRASGPSDLVLVVLEGVQVPDLYMGAISEVIDYQDMMANARGQVVIPIRLSGPGIGTPNELGHWSFSEQGGLKQVIRAGHVIDFDSDPSSVQNRRITFLSTTQPNTGGSDGRPSHLATDGGFWLIAGASTQVGLFRAQVELPGGCVGDIANDMATRNMTDDSVGVGDSQGDDLSPYRG